MQSLLWMKTRRSRPRACEWAAQRVRRSIKYRCSIYRRFHLDYRTMDFASTISANQRFYSWERFITSNSRTKFLPFTFIVFIFNAKNGILSWRKCTWLDGRGVGWGSSLFSLWVSFESVSSKKVIFFKFFRMSVGKFSDIIGRVLIVGCDGRTLLSVRLSKDPKPPS